MSNVNDKSNTNSLFKLLLIILQSCYFIVSIILFCSFILRINAIKSYVKTSYFWHNLFYYLLSDKIQIISIICILVTFLLAVIYFLLSIFKKFPPFMTSYVCIANSIICFIVNYFSFLLIERNAFWEFQIIILLPLISIILSTVFSIDDLFDYFNNNYLNKDSEKSKKYAEALDESLGKLTNIKLKQEIQTKKLNTAIDNIVLNEEVKMSGEEIIEMAASRIIPDIKPDHKSKLKLKDKVNNIEFHISEDKEKISPEDDTVIAEATNLIENIDETTTAEKESLVAEEDTVKSEEVDLIENIDGEQPMVEEEIIIDEEPVIIGIFDEQMVPNDDIIITEEADLAKNINELPTMIDDDTLNTEETESIENTDKEPTIIKDENVKAEESELIEYVDEPIKPEDDTIKDNELELSENIDDKPIISSEIKRRVIFSKPPESMYIDRKESILEHQKRILEDSENTIFKYQNDETDD